MKNARHLTEMDRKLKKYRDRIDRIDRRIVRLLASRYRLVRLIGLLKKSSGTPVVQPEREDEILVKIGKRVHEAPVREFIFAVYRSLFKASHRVEREGKNGHGT
jgi:monofunctional chorismate mutase